MRPRRRAVLVAIVLLFLPGALFEPAWARGGVSRRSSAGGHRRSNKPQKPLPPSLGPRAPASSQQQQQQRHRGRQQQQENLPAAVRLERLLTTHSAPLYSTNPWTAADTAAMAPSQLRALRQDVTAAVAAAARLGECPREWVFRVPAASSSSVSAPHGIRAGTSAAAAAPGWQPPPTLPSMAMVAVPPLHFVYRLYQATGFPAAREALLVLLRNRACAVDVTHAPPRELPLLAEVLRGSYRDTILVEHVLNATVAATAVAAGGTTRGTGTGTGTGGTSALLLPPGRGGGGSGGLSYLHLLSAGGLESLAVSKELLKVAAALAGRRPAASVREAYGAMDGGGSGSGSGSGAGWEAGGGGNSSVAESKKTLRRAGRESWALAYLLHHRTSPTFREVVAEWDRAIRDCGAADRVGGGGASGSGSGNGTSAAASSADDATAVGCRQRFFDTVEVAWQRATSVAEDYFLAYLDMFLAATAAPATTVAATVAAAAATKKSASATPLAPSSHHADRDAGDGLRDGGSGAGGAAPAAGLAAELDAVLPSSGRNVLHVLVLKTWPRAIARWVSLLRAPSAAEAHKAPAGAGANNSPRAAPGANNSHNNGRRKRRRRSDNNNTAVRGVVAMWALLRRDRYLGATPLHLALHRLRTGACTERVALELLRLLAAAVDTTSSAPPAAATSCSNSSSNDDDDDDDDDDNVDDDDNSNSASGTATATEAALLLQELVRVLADVAAPATALLRRHAGATAPAELRALGRVWDLPPDLNPLRTASLGSARGVAAAAGSGAIARCGGGACVSGAEAAQGARPAPPVPAPLAPWTAAVLELHEVPTPAALRQLLLGGQVLVLRGAAAAAFPRLAGRARAQWTGGKLRERFGHHNVEVAVVPYVSQHSRQLTLSQFLDNITAAEAAAVAVAVATPAADAGDAAFNGDGDGDVGPPTPYLFSTTFAPQVTADAEELLAYLRAVGADHLPIGGGGGGDGGDGGGGVASHCDGEGASSSSVAATGGRSGNGGGGGGDGGGGGGGMASGGGDAGATATVASTQFFVGGRGSGSPVHYHALAVNVVAWGRKRWWVAPVVHGAYSNEPGAARKSRLDDKRRQQQQQQQRRRRGRRRAGGGDGDDDADAGRHCDEQGVAGAAAVETDSHYTSFVQHALDVVIIPTDTPHWTVNTEFTVGMAVEATHLPSSPW